MRIVVVVKSDSVYNKIKLMFSDYDVLPNIPIFQELQEFVFSDEANVAIIDGTLHWKSKAEDLLIKYEIPYIIFNGNFDELVTSVNDRRFSNKSTIVEVDKDELNQEELAGLGQNSDMDSSQGGPVEKEIIYQIKEVQKFIDREVIREVLVETPVRVEVPVIVEKIVEVPVEVKVEVPVEKRVTVQQLKTMPKQLIVVGSLYSGAGSSFVSIALAKVLNKLRVDTCVVEYPANEPYLYVTLDGSTHLPRDYSFIFPQILQGQDIKKRSQEWEDDFITWMPADPAMGRITNWTSEHMSKCLYGIKNAVTILDISTSWSDPALKDILLQADHLLLIAGPEPARLLSSTSKSVKQYIKQELGSRAKIVANFVPDIANSKTKEWIDSLPGQTIVRIPGLPNADMVDAAWKGNTIFDDNDQILTKFLDCFYPLIREVIPRDYNIERPVRKGLINRLKFKIGSRGDR